MVNAIESDESRLFENADTPLARRLQDSLPGGWDAVRDSGIRPLHCTDLSDLPEAHRTRAEFLAGAELLGLTDEGMTIHPQQLLVSDVIGTGAETVVVEIPRRASKSTSILAVLLGRCLKRPRYKVTFSAQSGTKTAEFFREWLQDIEIGLGFTPEDSWPFRPRKQAGSLQFTFQNGSVFKFLNTPNAKALRGGAADVVWFDEAQEFGPELSAELKAGALPLMDTRDGAQLILSGTAGESRSGWLWDTLVTGRKGTSGVAILEYAAPEGTTHEDIDNEAIWIAAHPGIGTLTTLEKMRSRREAFADPEWCREYLGLWPEDFSTAVIAPEVWEAAGIEMTPRPQDAALGYDISPNGSTSAIVAAWRVNGVAYIEVIEHQQGSTWVKPKVVALSKKYSANVGLNYIGSTQAVAEEITRARSIPKTRLKGQGFHDVPPACVTFLRDLQDGNLKHFKDASLTDAAMFAAKRSMGENRWAWGRIASGGDITPLMAATMALRAYDTTVKRTRLKAIVA